MKGLNIIVCIKSVSLRAGTEGALRSYDSLELNPFDRPVLETALRLKETEGGSVTALSMGPESGVAAISEGMRTMKEFVTVADAALYQAKEEGRNRVVVGT